MYCREAWKSLVVVHREERRWVLLFRTPVSPGGTLKSPYICSNPRNHSAYSLIGVRGGLTTKTSFLQEKSQGTGRWDVSILPHPGMGASRLGYASPGFYIV